MPGLVVAIQVNEGQQVEKGQTLMILESMKMEMPIEAPEKGTVKSIAVAEGQAVEEGATVVVIE